MLIYHIVDYIYDYIYHIVDYIYYIILSHVISYDNILYHTISCYTIITDVLCYMYYDMRRTFGGPELPCRCRRRAASLGAYI